MRLLLGIGINDVPNSAKTKEYKLWTSMLTRSYDEKLHQRRPTYLGCEVSDYFKKLSSFSSWCQNQVGFNQPGFELDKDLLVKGNKEYHPDKCVFIPREINSFLRTRSKSRGDLPIGVTLFKNGKYMATCSNPSHKQAHLGLHETPEQAFNAYKIAKEANIKVLANKYKDQIDPRAYNALMNYRVEITD